MATITKKRLQDANNFAAECGNAVVQRYNLTSNTSGAAVNSDSTSAIGNGDKVRIVFRDFPLSFHDKAQKAAEAGQCANEQGKFWEMHDWMFDNQSSLDDASLKAAARKISLDGDKFDQCLTSSKYASAVQKNLKEGSEAGVKGTPAFFVNGVFISGAQPFEKFKTEIDRALAE